MTTRHDSIEVLATAKNEGALTMKLGTQPEAALNRNRYITRKCRKNYGVEYPVADEQRSST